MRVLSPAMQGLTVKQADLYFVIRELCDSGEGSARRCEIAKAMKVEINDGNLTAFLGVLMVRHFVTRVDVGRYRADEPPHHVVAREICAEFKITKAELYGPRKTMSLCRARRVFARRLRKANYLMADIARIMHRDKSTVEDYFHPDRRLKRLVARSERKLRAKANAASSGVDKRTLSSVDTQIMSMVAP